jgi:hypothetical protein
MRSNKLRTHVAALMLLAPVAATFVAQPAAAQQRATVAQPSISNMTLNADGGLSPGSTLRVQVSATPNARKATLALGESGVVVPLKQQGAGNYTGSYVVRRTDRLDPTQLMTARVTFGDRTYSRQFNYPAAFQALTMGAAPAAAQNSIERFVMRPMGRMEPGRELHFRLMGAPGGDAWMDIPGVISGVDLAETRPGVYEGNYTVRRRDNLDAFRNAVATLRTGNQRATARLDLNWRDREVARDERAPQISDLTPANGDRVGDRGRTHISARLSDEGTGIDPANVRLRLNGRDVTGDARVTADEIHYRGDLGPGRYSVEISAKDQAGNATTKSWSFDVTPGGERQGAAGGGMPLQLTSHANNAVVDANGNLLLQGRTVPGATVRVQVDQVANVGGLLGVTQPVADATVQADRNGFFSVGVNPRGLPIPGTRYDVRLTATGNGGQTAEERLTLVQRQG